MKIKVTTDRKPWLNDRPLDQGSEIEATEAEAKILIDAGFAEIVEPAKAKRVVKE